MQRRARLQVRSGGRTQPGRTRMATLANVIWLPIMLSVAAAAPPSSDATEVSQGEFLDWIESSATTATSCIRSSASVGGTIPLRVAWTVGA